MTRIDSVDDFEDDFALVDPAPVSPLEESYTSTATRDGKDDKSSASFGDGLPGIKYTKSLYKKWNSKDVLIAVMGMTGSGKTTFISKVTGRTDLKIGHDLTSCTQEVQVVETKIDDHIVRFIDTPGFSDTYLSDTEVLEMIADYLAAAYSKDMKLSGIIYLHPISDTRVTHHATKNLEMFRKLTGNNNLKNVVLTTSMWDRVTPAEGDRRERELKEKFWNILMAFEAKSERYHGTAESARTIASTLVDNKPFYLQLQEEMGRGNKPLKDTAAGKEVMIELARMKEKHEKELEDMKEMLLRTTAEENKVAAAALEDHYKKMLRDMEKTLADERRMNNDAVRSLNERISALESRGGVCNIM
ncbi:P-loop containing nucleoside triphosphate hydrolase protein [Xylariaceae sp. FL1019]|nr:P-loop containing nucleoside triphosphate hydrolase protein [Xylariaceae sp. FL1019]